MSNPEVVDTGYPNGTQPEVHREDAAYLASVLGKSVAAVASETSVGKRSTPNCGNLSGDDADIFFSTDEDDIIKAKRICRGCVEIGECFDGARKRKEPYGVWGGILFEDGEPKTKRIKKQRSEEH